MSHAVSRRRFLKRSVLASTGAAMAIGLEEQVLLDRTAHAAAPKAAPGVLPQGTIKDLKIS